MKLYVDQCGSCKNKIYLNVRARSRSELRKILGAEEFYLTCNHCNYQNIFSVNEVFAESESNSTVTGGIVGGIIGLVGGPIGAVIGSSIGIAIGNSSDGEEKKRVDFFNHSF